MLPPARRLPAASNHSAVTVGPTYVPLPLPVNRAPSALASIERKRPTLFSHISARWAWMSPSARLAPRFLTPTPSRASLAALSFFSVVLRSARMASIAYLLVTVPTTS